MAIEWNDALTTGNAQIDSQHRELFQRFNALLAACNLGRGRHEITQTLLFLDDYIKSHFRFEEEMQRSSRFPDYVRHKEEHDDFVRKTDALAAQFREEGASLVLLVKTNRILMDWLIGHILRMDRDFAQYLAGANEGSTAGAR